MNSKRKCRQYSEYLQFGFIPSPSNVQLPMCLVCGKSFFNEVIVMLCQYILLVFILCIQ